MKCLKIDYILNTPVLTEFGVYKFIKYYKKMGTLDLSGAISAVGHESTAKWLSSILKSPVITNRISIHMQVGETALVFKINGRISEGKLLSTTELKKIPYTLCIMERIA